MPSKAISAQGTLIKRGNGATPTEVFATIGEVTSFSGPGGSATVIDVTSFDSTGKEKLAGLKDEGQFTFECNLVGTDVQQKGLFADRDGRVKRNFEVVLPDTTEINFTALVLGLSIGGAVDDKVTLSVTLEITGPSAITWPVV